MNRTRNSMRMALLVGVLALWGTASLVHSAELVSFAKLERQYTEQLQPVVKRLCLECHSTETKEGRLDLERFAKFSDVRTDPLAWQKVAEMLGNGEMPPKDSPQPTKEELQLLSSWVRKYLDTEAHASTGDPGPVVLRRLSNAEYTYTIRDLTGVELDPAKEFPVDGAAGEGFTNTGNALVMSPALFTKYLDAAKEIATHAVLLPDGIRFSEANTRRNMTNELLSEIRSIYLRHTSGAGDLSRLNSWNVANPLQATDDDGRVDLTKYFAALMRHRAELKADPAKATDIAAEEKLNPKYLRLLAEMLVSGEPNSLLLNLIRARWEHAKPEEAPTIAAEVKAWQAELWKFNTVAHYGATRPWQESANKLPEGTELRQAIDPNSTAPEVSLYLCAQTLGAEKGPVGIIWKRSRFEFKDRPAIRLQDARLLAELIEKTVGEEVPRIELYLATVAELQSSSQTLDALAAEKKLNPRLLRNLSNYLGLNIKHDLALAGHLNNQMLKVGGQDAINGWGVPATPCILANSSDQPINIGTLTIPPHAVTAHPSPDELAMIAWQSPIAGQIRIAGKITDADAKCGNGANWTVELRANTGARVLAEGEFNSGGQGEFNLPDALDIKPNESVIVSIGPKNRDHGCDTTHVELMVTQQQVADRVWDLSKDVSSDILTGNPHADRFGNKEVWHFLSSKQDSAEKPKLAAVPAGSALERWRAAAMVRRPAAELTSLAAIVKEKLFAQAESLSDADAASSEALADWSGPLGWIKAVELPAEITGDAKRESVFAKSDEVLEYSIPTRLVRGGEFLVEGTLDPTTGTEAAAQFQLTSNKPAEKTGPSINALFVTLPGSPARAKIEKSYDDFRSFFPAAMCYARIVPVDEVVTLVLYHREDEQLARLMLTEAEIERLNRLWEELRFVSQDALVSVTACEQLIEFATQDRQDLVPIFKEMQKQILARAEAFRQELLATEPAQIEAVLKLAEQAYRRPLAERERRELNELYPALRDEGSSHEEAVRLLLARVLASPAFLYRIEQPGPGSDAVPVSDWELASRLSYFLWASMPDEELRAAAAAGTLHQPEVLLAQTRRMLRDEKTRRMAIEFACQWLHVRAFDQHDEKSEDHFPTFGNLRSDMYEESIRFFTDLIQNDGSVLDILAADHTFLNARLAGHYGIPNIAGDEWRKVTNLKSYQRGGVLTQATILATQSGASRTSPILRGNWVSETLLGDRLPRPPKGVPVLPEDVPAGLTERQLIEKHTTDAGCAKCHARIDPLGFALENFDAIGRLRERDAENHPIDVHAKLVDGTEFTGVDGLRNYLLNERRDDFVRQFCRKMLGYALGRSVQLSDQPLLDKMQADLAANSYRVSVAVEDIVLSDQFQNIRGGQYVGTELPHAEEPTE